MSGFTSPVVGGQSTLIRPAIESPNYVAGSSGWIVKRDGSAEFNNLIVRGTFFGTNYIINNAGAFFYNGTPASGNLIASIAPAAGTDGFGNAYLKGIAVYNTITGSALDLLSGLISMSNPGAVTPGTIAIATLQSGPDSLQLSSPAINANDIQAFLSITRGAVGTAALVNVANAALCLQSSFNTVPTPANGVSLYSDIDARQPSMLKQSGMQMVIPGAALATFPGTTVTAAVLTNLATFSINANDAVAGACYEIECEGNWTQATGSPVTFQFGAALAGNNLANQIIGTGGFTAGGTGRYSAKVRIYCLSNGVSGTWQATMKATVTPNANPNNSVTVCDDDSGSILTLDTTVNRTLALRFAWGSTAGSPSIVNRRQIAKRIS